MTHRSRRGITRLAILASLPGFSCLPALAQSQTSNRQPYTFQRTVRRVVLDVVVTDRNHNFVHGLRRRDFTISENGQRQEIRSFEERQMNTDTLTAPVEAPPLPANTWMDVPTEPERGPLYVIVYDMDDMDLPDAVQARRELQKFLATKPAGTRFALFIVAEDVHLVEGFTSDPQKLLAAFDVSRQNEHLPWVFLYRGNYASEPWQVLAFLGRYLEGLPGRKNVIWLASQFPIDLPDWQIPNMQGGKKDLGGGYRPAPGTMGESYGEKMMREAINAIDNAQIALYPIDLEGVGTYGFGSYDWNAADAAATTGGRANQENDILGALRDATEDGAAYYELTYAPSAPDYDGKMRNIRVALSRKGDSLSYRKYYFADQPNAPLTNDEKRIAAATAGQNVAHHIGDSLYSWMEHGAPMAHDILFRAHVSSAPAEMATPAQMADLQNQPGFFVLRKRDLQPQPLPPIPLQLYSIDYLVLDQNSRPGQVFEFAACAYDGLGHMLNGISQNAVREQPRQKGDSAYLRGVQTLEVPTTAAWLRVAVHDIQTDRIGTIEIRLPLAASVSAPTQVQSRNGGEDRALNSH